MRCARRSHGRLPAVLFLLFFFVWPATELVAAAQPPPEDTATVRGMLQLLSPQGRQAALERVRENWRPEYAVMVLELIQLSRDARFNRQLIKLLEKKTGQEFGSDLHRWWEWQWSEERPLHPLYPEFKAQLFGLVDGRFRKYFSPERKSLIRLDEVRWGGVGQDGIPPLRFPKTIPVDEATYLAAGDIIFGLVHGGEARAYPKRILGWHEMVVDEVADEPITGVYCPLCGVMIAYRTKIGNTVHEMGTSGFLYRSNKLMFDKATQSLWNTIWGRPVIGPLVDRGIELEAVPVVTTTWGEWRRRHPETRVLSKKTGHRRDYSEGEAYRDYFASGDLMFPVAERDARLPKKAEILGLLLPQHPEKPVAFSHRFLVANPVAHHQIGDVELLILTDSSGAHRVYESGGITFKSYDGRSKVDDDDGVVWTLTEDELRAPDGKSLPRLAAHGAFWFGWYAAYPRTGLVDLKSD